MPGRKPRDGADAEQRSGGRRNAARGGGRRKSSGGGGVTRRLLQLCLLVAIGSGVYMAWRVPVGGRSVAQHARLWWKEHGWHPVDEKARRDAARLQVAQPGDEPPATVDTTPLTPEPRQEAPPAAAERAATVETESAPTQARTARREPRATPLRERITDEDRKTIERLMR